MRLSSIAGELIQDLRITCRSLLRAPDARAHHRRDRRPRDRRDDGHVRRRRRGAPAAAAVCRAGRARAHLHRHAAVPVPVFAGRLPRARGAADDVRAGGRLHRAGRRRSATARSPSSCAGGWCRWSYLRSARPQTGPRPRVHRGDGKPGQPAGWSSSVTGSGSSAWVRARTRSASRSGSTAWTTRSTGVMPPAVGPAGAQPGLLHRGAVGHAAPQGPVFHHHARARAGPARRRGRGGAAGDQQAHLSDLADPHTRTNGRPGAWWTSRKSLVARLQADRAALAHRGRARVVDCVCQRVEPARRARHEPEARAGGEDGARRVAAARHSLPARRKRRARGRRGRSSAWRSRASGIGLVQRFGAAFVPRTHRNRARGPNAVGAAGRDGDQRRDLRPRAGAARNRRAGGRRAAIARPVVDRQRRVRRLRQALVGSQFAVATPLLIVAGLLLGSLDNLRTRRSRFRQPQPADGEYPSAARPSTARSRSR